MADVSAIPTNPSDFQKSFDPLQYTLRYFGTPPPKNKLRTLCLKTLHNFFNKVISDLQHEVRVLDYGCGPVVAYSISAAGNERVSEIVFSDYALPNCDALRQWLLNKGDFDWSPYFKYVVQTLEGKSETDVSSREERMRAISKVVSCDITAEHPSECGYEGPYDIVTTILAIENVCKTEEEYLVLVRNLSKLVKPGGYLLMFSQLSRQRAQPIYYDVGEEKIYYYAVTRELVLKALEDASFNEVVSSQISMQEIVADLPSSEASHIESFSSSDDFFYMFVQAKKLSSP